MYTSFVFLHPAIQTLGFSWVIGFLEGVTGSYEPPDPCSSGRCAFRSVGLRIGLPISGLRRRFQDMWFNMLVAWSSRWMATLGRCPRLLQCCAMACKVGQTLGASGNSPHPRQGNHTICRCQDVRVLMWHNGWTPGQFSESVLDTLLLLVYPCSNVGHGRV